MLETDDKNLVGKFILVTLTSHELSELLLGEHGAEGHPWFIGGTVEGKTTNLGLWLRVVVIQDTDGKTLTQTRLGEGEMLLLPWHFLNRTTLYEKKPEKIGTIGFNVEAKNR